MSLHVEITGQGADVVLLHGWAMHGGVFANVVSALSSSYRVHNIDLPGHGRSANSASADLPQLMTAVLPHVPEHAMVMGWSLGGLVALKLAQQQALAKLVLVSTTPRFVADESWPQGMQPKVFAQFFMQLQHNLDLTVQDFLRLQVRGDAHAASTLATLKAGLIAHPANPAALQTGLEILRDADERSALARITTPSLVLAGEYDRIAHPDASRYLAEQLPHAQFGVIGRAGHAPFLSHHDEFMQTVSPFLSVQASAHG